MATVAVFCGDDNAKAPPGGVLRGVVIRFKFGGSEIAPEITRGLVQAIVMHQGSVGFQLPPGSSTKGAGQKKEKEQDYTSQRDIPHSLVFEFGCGGGNSFLSAV